MSENFIQGVRRDTLTQIQLIEKKRKRKIQTHLLFFFEKRRPTVEQARSSAQAQKEKEHKCMCAD